MVANKVLKKLLRRCPICLDSFGDILYNQRFIMPEGHFLPETYHIVACQTCGFVYADTPAGQDDYDRYYAELSKYEDNAISSGGGFTAWDADRIDRMASDIAGILSDKNTAILDVGCANGGLLVALKGKGYMNLTGLDPSPVCVATVRQQGINAVKGGIFSDYFVREFHTMFECVIVSHVMEHIYDLRTAVNNLLACLKPGGLLYVEVPDASRYSDFYITPYHYFDCEHINHFDEDALNNLFGRLGCEQIKTAKKIMPVSHDHVYPAFYMVFQKKDGLTKDCTPEYTRSNVRERIIDYIETSRQASYWPQLEELAASQEEIVVWGMGSYTRGLLEKSDLGRCNIIRFIDKDPKKHGTKVNGIAISSVDILAEHTGPIVVCSALYSDEIVREIGCMSINNRVIVIK